MHLLRGVDGPTSSRARAQAACGDAGVGITHGRAERMHPPNHFSTRSGHAPGIGRQRAAALVRDVRDVGAGQVLELRADQVLRRAVAVGPVVVLAGLRLQQRDQFGHVLGRCAGIHDQHVRHQRDLGDRRQVLLEVVGQLLVDAGGDGVVHRADQQRVPIGLGLGDIVGAERGAGARFALDDHRLDVGEVHRGLQWGPERVRKPGAACWRSAARTRPG